MQIKELQKLKIRGRVVAQQPMKELTSLKIGGQADLFVVPEDLEDLKTVISFCKEREICLLVIGNGSKLLIRDEGFKGVVAKLGTFFTKIENEGEEITVGAGLDLSTLIDFVAEKGFSGLELLAGIPGTVGGAITRNASAFGQDLGQRVISVRALDSNNGDFTISKEDILFGYRTSIFLGKRDWIITEVKLALSPEKKEDVLSRLREARDKKIRTQPISSPSAGCVFKNPGSSSAGVLIQRAGCSGMRVGDAQVSIQHANFIINKGNARARDIIELIDMVRERVKISSGITLEPELEII
jgi:UDP-N-acetylmuramate dehydrogenase